jgi:hypothetical protein
VSTSRRSARSGNFAEVTLERRPVEEANDLDQSYVQIRDECRKDFALLLDALERLMGPQS